MKKYILTLIFTMMMALGFANALENLKHAENLINNAEIENDFSLLFEAEQAYLSALKDMPKNSKIYYNLAVINKLLSRNAYAMFYIKKAMLLEPQNQKYQNTYLLLEDIVNKNYVIPEQNKFLPYIFPIFFHTNILIKTALAILSLAIALCLVIFLKNSKKQASIIFFVIFLIMTIYVTIDLLGNKTEAVLMQETIAYSGNSKFFEEAYNKPLPEGSVVQILKKQNTWYYVRLPDGNKVWLGSAKLLIVNR